MPAITHRDESSRELKKERIELRVAASAKELIQQAMAVSGLTAGQRPGRPGRSSSPRGS